MKAEVAFIVIMFGNYPFAEWKTLTYYISMREKDNSLYIYIYIYTVTSTVYICLKLDNSGKDARTNTGNFISVP